MNNVFARISCSIILAVILSLASSAFADTPDEKMPRGAIQPALLGGCRFLQRYDFEYGFIRPSVDAHFLVGPYVRF